MRFATTKPLVIGKFRIEQRRSHLRKAQCSFICKNIPRNARQDQIPIFFIDTCQTRTSMDNYQTFPKCTHPQLTAAVIFSLTSVKFVRLLTAVILSLTSVKLVRLLTAVIFLLTCVNLFLREPLTVRSHFFVSTCHTCTFIDSCHIFIHICQTPTSIDRNARQDQNSLFYRHLSNIYGQLSNFS